MPRKTDPVADFVKWFYEEHLGVKPDRSCYARQLNRKNPRALIHLMKEDPDDPYQPAIYSGGEIVGLVRYLTENGIDVTTIGVVTIPELMFHYTNRFKSDRSKQELERVVEYLRTNKDDNDGDFDELPGW